MIIGIGGCSRSGKSTLAAWMLQELVKKGHQVRLLAMDDFALPVDQMPLVRGEPDWDHPDAYDWSKMRSQLERVRQEKVTLILEGIFIFYPTEFSSFWDKAIFITLSKVSFLQRRQAETRWGKEPAWYLEHVWEAFAKYGRIGLPADHLELSGESLWEESVLHSLLG
ncbi:MAG: hypothetical protein AAFR61_22665 [Bacteroidota bacterium]